MSVWVLYYVINWIHPTYQTIFRYHWVFLLLSDITIPSILGMFRLCFFLFVPFCGFSKRFVGIVDYSGYIIEERVLSKWKKCMKINLKGFKIFMSGSLLKYSITLGKSVISLKLFNVVCTKNSVKCKC